MPLRLRPFALFQFYNFSLDKNGFDWQQFVMHYFVFVVKGEQNYWYPCNLFLMTQRNWCHQVRMVPYIWFQIHEHCIVVEIKKKTNLQQQHKSDNNVCITKFPLISDKNREQQIIVTVWSFTQTLPKIPHHFTYQSALTLNVLLALIWQQFVAFRRKWEKMTTLSWNVTRITISNLPHFAIVFICKNTHVMLARKSTIR